MADIPRLNGVIPALEAGKPTFTSFCCKPIRRPRSRCRRPKYDGIVYEMEHNPWDIRALRIASIHAQPRPDRQIRLAHARPSPRWCAFPRTAPRKRNSTPNRRLDLGAYGIVWPTSHRWRRPITRFCRLPLSAPQSAPLYEPAGIRGDGADRRVALLGLRQQDYYARADVWRSVPGRSVRDP